jgi:hypothetical protein
MADAPEEAAEQEPPECPKGHGPMRLRTRWAGQQARPGRSGGRGEPIMEWVCPRCGRTATVD